MAEKQNPKPQTLWQKLAAMQAVLKTFAVEEDSDKKDASGTPTYRYTPGWKIIESIREMMDAHGLMLVSNCVRQESKLIDYLVYKDFHGQAMSFSKKEMFVEVEVAYTWIDTLTGEQAGPFIGFGYGANGTDKSGATAMSMAKRYFLMNFFHFTTRETADEQDAHDSGNIPGFSASQQPNNLNNSRSAQAVPAPQPYMPQGQPAAVQGAPYGQPPIYCPVAPPAPGQYAPQAPAGYASAPVHARGSQAPQQATPAGQFNQADPAIQAAISALMCFDKGTSSHQRSLNEQIGRLSSLGYQCTTPEFIGQLVDTAQAMRTGTAK